MELDAAGFPFAAVNPFAMSDTPTVVLLYTALYTVGNMAAVAPAKKCVDGQQVFDDF